MIIKFVFKFNLAQGLRDLRRLFNEWTCERKGHVWEEYKEKKNNFYDHYLMFSMFGRQNEVKTHECKRCGESKYKEIIGREDNKKEKTIKFRRYSKLKVKKGSKK